MASLVNVSIPIRSPNLRETSEDNRFYSSCLRHCWEFMFLPACCWSQLSDLRATSPFGRSPYGLGFTRLSDYFFDCIAINKSIFSSRVEILFSVSDALASAEYCFLLCFLSSVRIPKPRWILARAFF